MQSQKKAYGLIVDAQSRYVLGEDNRNFLRTAIGYRDCSGACADYESLESTAGGSLYSERPRADELVQIDLDVTARDWSFYGFAPKVQMRVGHNHSAISLYSMIGASSVSSLRGSYEPVREGSVI